ncbi:hypothetical protein IFM47457_07974 [Aspergillus lentulus]|nr:hypothetical protein IFM47457_07974 [Aspergillus lentulus]
MCDAGLSCEHEPAGMLHSIRRYRVLHFETICLSPGATSSGEGTVARAPRHTLFGQKRGERLSRPTLLDRHPPEESLSS